MHFCMDELRIILLGVPFLGAALLIVRSYWHRIFHRVFHKGPPKSDGCCPPDHKH